jgi:hypothetical protein
MRNMAAWIEGVHGYLEAQTPGEKAEYVKKTAEMVENELANAKELLRLWEAGKTGWIPLSETGETLHMYGANFGELLKKKIRLMEQHREDEPAIDPHFMWRIRKYDK